ncbi:MAG: hypothetical protein JNL28_01085 [Planctomycetes bacterium]|nr:hypothetical protein [Planctomycetota bacterium]
MRTIPFCVSMLVLAAPAFAGKVWVVGPLPAPHQDLQDAIIAAQDGDIILVRHGTYESVRTVGRSVTIVAENGATVQLPGAVRVADFPASKTLVLSGLRAAAGSSTSVPQVAHGLHIRTCPGQVIAQDCTFTSSLNWSTYGTGVVDVRDCGGLALVRCGIVGATPGVTNNSSGIAVGPGAHVSLEQISAQGAAGRNGFPPPTGVFDYADGCAGSPGLYYSALANEASSFVFASNSQFQGGVGGYATWGAQLCTFCGYAGSGGDGIFGANPASPLILLGVTAIGAPGGAGPVGCPGGLICGTGSAGPPGQAIYAGHPLVNRGCIFSGTTSSVTPYTNLSGAPRTLAGPRLVRDDTRPTFQFQGSPSEFVELGIARHPLFQPATGAGGVLHVFANEWRRVGVVSTTGTLSTRFKLPDLPVTDPGATLFLQARFIDPTSGAIRLSNLHVVVLLDASY